MTGFRTDGRGQGWSHNRLARILAPIPPATGKPRPSGWWFVVGGRLMLVGFATSLTRRRPTHTRPSRRSLIRRVLVISHPRLADPAKAHPAAAAGCGSARGHGA